MYRAGTVSIMIRVMNTRGVIIQFSNAISPERIASIVAETTLPGTTLVTIAVRINVLSRRTPRCTYGYTTTVIIISRSINHELFMLMFAVHAVISRGEKKNV